ncbi:glycosyltransferase [Rossellomorea aquimaris]|uniref:glycosyltransferase n=1 Tax=Rossellomorea aquimaris TaxID=189382 RepID=UPI0007D0A518|nr:glycosyltransferase family 2 protein [Rossellomorea aquimaris]
MIIYIVLSLVFVVFTFLNLLFLPKLSKKASSKELVSILIPMRNEERNVEGVIDSLKGITYSPIEFIILNDGSTDQTLSRLTQRINKDTRFKVMNGKPLPDGWIGKVHACHQLSKEARGRYYFFLDADVRVSSTIIEKVLYQMKKHQSGLVTGFPRFPVKPFLGKMLVPFQHFLVYFHLPLMVANKSTAPSFTAAHGAFMFFDREAYKDCGGHESVNGSLVEDVHLARRVKSSGWKVSLINNTLDVSCNMYNTNEEVWNGFLKNVYIGIGRNPISVIVLSLFYFVFYVFPLPLFIYGIINEYWLYLLPLFAVWIQTWMVDVASKQSPIHFLFMPIASISFILIMWASMVKSIRKQGYVWKGRTYS